MELRIQSAYDPVWGLWLAVIQPSQAHGVKFATMGHGTAFRILAIRVH